MSIDDLLARGFNIERYHPLDTIERRRSTVDVLSDRQWKCFFYGAARFLRVPNAACTTVSAPGDYKIHRYAIIYINSLLIHG